LKKRAFSGHAEMASVSIDAIVEQVGFTLDTLETIIAPYLTAQTSDDGVYALGETADLFKVWLSNTTVAREKCTSFEECLRNDSELRLTLAELLVDIKDDLAEGKCDRQLRWRITVRLLTQRKQHKTLHNMAQTMSRCPTMSKSRKCPTT
jgi:hypothetical protein